MTGPGGDGASPDLHLQVVLGPCDDMRAELFVRCTPPRSSLPGLRLEGRLVGPECRHSNTLPAGAPLTDMGSGASGLLARAVLTEPAFWTPELPNLYWLEARATAGGGTVGTERRRIGLRRSGVRGRSLWLEGRRWVPRGVGCAAAAIDPVAFRESGTAAVVPNPEEAACSAADEAGVAIIAAIDEPRLDQAIVAERIAMWALHPSVVMAVLPGTFDDGLAAASIPVLRRLKGTMLLARVVDGGTAPPSSVAEEIDVLVLSLVGDGLPHAAWRDAPPELPIVAWRRDGTPPEQRRRGCDRLQAALAAWGLADGRPRPGWDWAGYVVS